MRTIYLFLLAFLPVLCWSCYDDKGNYDYHELNRTEVTGIEPVYRCDLLSRLFIPTVIQSEDKGRTYDYVWMAYQTTGDRKIDTLSQEKDLDWIVSADPGIYRLVFEYRDKQNGVANYIESELIIEIFQGMVCDEAKWGDHRYRFLFSGFSEYRADTEKSWRGTDRPAPFFGLYR